VEVGAGAARVPLVEDQIQHVQDGAQPLGALVIVRHAERHARRLDGLFRPADALRHRRVGHEERARDLGRREPAHGAQRQRDGRRGRERRMTAHEEQQQRVVRMRLHGQIRRRRERLLDPPLADDDVLATASREFTPEIIGHPPHRDLEEPAARVGRDPLLRPLRGRRDERFLNRVLRGREVPVTPRDRAEHLRCEVAQQVPEIRRRRPCRGVGIHASAAGALMTCRTSIGMTSGLPPGPGAADAFAAISYARSGVSTSTIQ